MKLTTTRARDVLLAGALMLCAVAGLLGFSGAAAQAQLVHPFLGSFGSFTNVQGVAVDQPSGDVYVLDVGADGGAGAVLKFDAAGNPVNFSATGTNAIEGVGTAEGGLGYELAVDSSTGPARGDIYVASNDAVRIYSSEGSLLGELAGSTGCGVAVDTSGNVYVSANLETVKKYTPVSNPVSAADESASMGGVYVACDLAVDGEGNLYAATYFGQVNKYPASQFGSSEAAGTLVDQHGRTLAVDPGRKNLLVDEDGQVSEYDLAVESPSLLDTFGGSGPGMLSGSSGVAVNTTTEGSASGHVYVSDGSGHVSIFGPAGIQPDVSTQGASGVSSATATVHGTVNPDAIPVSDCRFEYGSEAEAADGQSEATYGHSVPCTPAPGSGNAPVVITAQLSGLTAGATYHYRLAASNANGTSHGEVKFFTTASLPASGEAQACSNQRSGESLNLPDCRAYEVVSPQVKEGNDVIGLLEGGQVEASQAGDAVVFSALGSFAEPVAGALLNIYLSGHGEQGWSTHSISPREGIDPPYLAEAAVFYAFTNDLTAGIVIDSMPLVPGAPEHVKNIYRRDNSDSSYGLYTPTGPPASQFAPAPSYLAASTDLRHVVFSDEAQLTPDAPEAGINDPNLYESSDGEMRLVGILPDGSVAPRGVSLGGWTTTGSVANAVSEDGSRVFFTAKATPEALATGIYMREDGAHTVQISPPGDRAAYWTASSSGSKVLFSRPDGSGAPELDLYDVASGVTTQIAPSAGGPTGFYQATGLIAANDDLTHVYFVSTEQLVAGQGKAGSSNLYLWSEGALSYIATGNFPESTATGSLAGGRPRTTASGRYLAFSSSSKLTHYENVGHAEVYRYDAQAQHLTCVSCNADGAPPTANSELSLGSEGSTIYGAVNWLPRNLNENGEVFFDSGEALVPHDTNGAIDVYEYKDGHVSLISSGRGGSGARFKDASADGENVFFVTRDRLVEADRDNLVDLYDAHVGAVSAQPLTPPACSGTGCQGVPSAQPIFATPPSVTYNGVGNFQAPPPKATVKSLSRAQKLARALKACHAKKAKKRSRCEATARKRYGPAKRAVKKTKAKTQTVSRRAKR